MYSLFLEQQGKTTYVLGYKLVLTGKIDEAVLKKAPGIDKTKN